MAIFDALPAKIRKAVREARYSWPVHELQQRLDRGETEDQIIRLIAVHEAAYYEARRVA